MKKIKWLLLCVFAAAMVPTQTAFASAPVHIGISVAQQHIDLEPGTVLNDAFFVFNRGTAQVDISVTVAPFDKSDFGNVNENRPRVDRSQLARWTSVDGADKFTMEPGSKREIAYTINVPQDFPAGGQYAQIIVVAKASDPAGSGVSGEYGLGFKIYARTTGGDTRDSAKLIAHEVPRFYFKGPIGATAKIENTGNIDVAVSMKLKVTDIFFKNREAYNNDTDEFFILPETTRAQTNQWAGAPMLGLFRVESTVSFLGENYDRAEVVLIFPLFLLIVILVIMILIVVYAVFRAKKRKAEKQAAM